MKETKTLSNYIKELLVALSFVILLILLFFNLLILYRLPPVEVEEVLLLHGIALKDEI